MDYTSKESKRKTSKPEDTFQLLASVKKKAVKISKKMELVYAFTNEKLNWQKKDFSLYITKPGKVFSNVSRDFLGILLVSKISRFRVTQSPTMVGARGRCFPVILSSTRLMFLALYFLECQSLGANTASLVSKSYWIHCWYLQHAYVRNTELRPQESPPMNCSIKKFSQVSEMF